MSAYLDHAASTPMLGVAREAVIETLGVVGNASSLHASGRRARKIVEESREKVAAALGSKASEVVFTAGGTESDNLAVKGVYWSAVDDMPSRRRVISSPIEHQAVLDPLIWLSEHAGAEVDLLDVDAQGLVSTAQLREKIAANPDNVALVTVMWANNEVGTIEPIADLAAVAHEFGVCMHTDAVQAIGQLPVSFSASGVDAMTISGHKIGGPHGVGALLVNDRTRLTALSHGGGQERGLRSGTPDVAAIAGMAAAIEHWGVYQPAHSAKLRNLRSYLIEQVQNAVPDAILNGVQPPSLLDEVNQTPEEAKIWAKDLRLPANAHFSFPGCEGDALLMLLDAAGVECSTGSACNAGIPEPSHVLLRMGLSDDIARSSLRFSLGENSTKADIDRLVSALPDAVARASKAKVETARSPR